MAISRGVSLRDIDPSMLGPHSPLLALMRRKPRADHEHQEQVKVFTWALEHEDQYPELEWLFAVPNFAGRLGKRTAQHGARLKAEGRKPGVLDIWFPVKRGGHPGMVIEMKAGNNKPTVDQQRWISHLARQGWVVLVSYSAENAIRNLEEYLTLKTTPRAV
jgi:hypothetical protein